MNRLRDEYPNDPLAEEGIALLRATAPTHPMPDVKRRVWISLWAAGATAMPRTRRRRLVATPAFVLVVVGISVAATAGAVIGRHWIAPESDADAAASAAAVGTAAASRRPMARRLPSRPPAAQPDVSSDGARASAAAAPKRETLVEVSPLPARRSVARSGGRGIGAASPSSGLQAIAGVGPKSEVLEALIALRRDGEPGRAGALIDRYLRANPRGALREEALVLAIEAATARGDASAAERFAKAYRAGYPTGRFRAFADSHLPASSR